jgi:hypothetical protein
MHLKPEAIARHKASLLLIVCLFVYLFIYLFICLWVPWGIKGEKKPTVGGVSKDGKLAERNATLCGVGILIF